jgi:hypothetical protein
MVFLKFNLKAHKKSYDHFPETYGWALLEVIE